MGKECGAWVIRHLWGGGNTSPLKTTAWEAIVVVASHLNSSPIGECGEGNCKVCRGAASKRER